MARNQPQAPNLYDVHGGHLHVTYSTSGIDGRPHFTYQDPTIGKSFSGDEIDRVDTLLGAIVSVRIRLTVDAGSTTFSLLVPRVNLIDGGPTAIHTEGITTLHQFSLVPPLDRGQRDFYTVTSLRGTAQHVVF